MSSSPSHRPSLERRSFLQLSLVVPALLYFGCGGPTFILQAYPGPTRDSDTIAIVRINGTDPVQLLAVDGEATDARIAEDSRLHVEVLPGKHVLFVQSSIDPELPPQRVLFQALPGKVYRPIFAANPNGGWVVARVYEVDRKSDRLLTDVSGAWQTGPFGARPSAPAPSATPVGASAPPSAAPPATSDPAVPSAPPASPGATPGAPPAAGSTAPPSSVTPSAVVPMPSAPGSALPVSPPPAVPLKNGAPTRP
jgi:hypothetical protein